MEAAFLAVNKIISPETAQVVGLPVSAVRARERDAATTAIDAMSQVISLEIAATRRLRVHLPAHEAVTASVAVNWVTLLETAQAVRCKPTDQEAVNDLETALSATSQAILPETAEPKSVYNLGEGRGIRVKNMLVSDHREKKHEEHLP